MSNNYVPIHNSFSSVCVYIKVSEGKSHWIFICAFLLSCHFKNTMSENVCLYFILCVHSLDSFRLAVFPARIEYGFWVTPLLTFSPQYSGDSTWPRLKSNWRVYQQKNRAIVLSAGTWLPCRLKRLLFWGFLHYIRSEIAITNVINLSQKPKLSNALLKCKLWGRWLCRRRIFREATAHLSGVCLFSRSLWWPILSNGFPPKIWTKTEKFMDKISIAMPRFYPCH